MDNINYLINIYTENSKTIEDKKLEEEIDNIFNNTLSETCYIYYDTPLLAYNLIGFGESITVSDFTALVPNLFRSCYAQVNTKIPYICPTYTNPINTVNYYPVLIDTTLIKSFLYFNFPSSIKYFNNNYNFINSIYKYKNIKNVNMTNSSFTPGSNIIYDIYSKKSLLIQLFNFNIFLTKSNNAKSNNLLINNIIVDWDFTKSCVTYTKSETNVYTISNYTKNTTLFDQGNADNLYSIRNSQLYLYKNESINTNGLIILQNYSIYTILEIVSQVYEDIGEEIKFYFQKKNYCKKSYMYTYNIPILLKIYKNYYNNQIYTISKNLSSTNPYTITPTVINIVTYVNDFISIYDTTYATVVPKRYLIKTLYLDSGIDALIIYNTVGPNWGVGLTPNNTIILYYYYYINTAYPSPIELFNINTSPLTYTQLTGNITAFSNVYNTAYNIKYSYTISKNIQYNTYGLYTCAGSTTVTGSVNINAIVFYFVNSSNILQSILFETLESPKTNYSGTPAGTDGNVAVPGLVLQLYQNV